MVNGSWLEPIVAVHNILREELWQHAKISVHGKTRIWNRGGVGSRGSSKGRGPERQSLEGQSRGQTRGPGNLGHPRGAGRIR